MMPYNGKENDLNDKHYEVQDQFHYGKVGPPLLLSNCSEYVVAHSNVSLKPLRQMSEVSFLPHIMCAMRDLRFTQILRVQSYSWPYLKQGLNYGAVIVSGPRSGRTLSYVPPLCQVVCTTLSEHRVGKLWTFNGPIALVLTADLSRVQRIGSLCNAMLRKAKNEEWLTLVLTVPSAYTPEFFQRLLNGIGCLVATPAQFLWMCTYNIQMPSLRFVVYDDVDLMPPKQLHKAHKQLQLLAQKQSLQLVITAQSYRHKWLKMVQEFCAHPLLLFGDILEAALYGGTNVRITLLKRDAKHKVLLHLLEERPPSQLRTVINCSTDEDIQELVQLLNSHGYGCLPYYQTADLDVREDVHRWMQESRGELLLCTDHCPELNIRHAHTLVHYGLSDSWSKFKLRHLALSDNLRNQLTRSQLEERSDSDQSLQSFVFLDENNNNKLPRLVDFLQLHQSVDESIVDLANNIRSELEKIKSHEPVLCNILLSTGHCADTHCDKRHQLLRCDRMLPAQLPTYGDVKLQLVKVYSPSHYCVRLLEHKPPGGSWHPLLRHSTLEMKLQVLQLQECVHHWPPQAKEICVYRNSTGYERVRILWVAPIAQVNLSSTNIVVEVQAMDINTRQFKTVSGKLYVCPEELRYAPPLAMDLRILGLVPYTGERSWYDEDAIKCTQLLNDVSQPCFMQANLVTSLSHTLFVHELAAIRYAPNLKVHLLVLNMCQELKRHQLARKCDQAIAKLMKFLEVESNPQPTPTETAEAVTTTEAKTATAMIIPHRYDYFAKMALQVGRANRLRMEKEKQQQLEATEEQAKETDQNDDPEDSIKALYNCLKDCVMLEMTAESKDNRIEAEKCILPAVLLNQVMQPQAEQLEVHTEIMKKPAVAVKKLEVECQLPANVVRPEVIYYQTLCTLELQLMLVEEMQYNVALHNNCCIVFWTSDTTAEHKYQFTLNTRCPYRKLTHHMQGRTVYISALKASPLIYPLDFSFYKFMKPNHDKLNNLEEERRQSSAAFEIYLLQEGYISDKKLKLPLNTSETSSDEYPEESTENVEGPVDIKNLLFD